jgi:hypothetical protein
MRKSIPGWLLWQPGRKDKRNAKTHSGLVVSQPGRKDKRNAKEHSGLVTIATREYAGLSGMLKSSPAWLFRNQGEK